MQRTTLWVVRHGQSKAQTGEEEVLNPNLSEVGVEQARSLSSVIGPMQFDHVRLSPLIRAWKTYLLSGASCDDTAFDSRLVECTLTPGRNYDYSPLLPYTTPDIGRPDRFNAWNQDPAARIASLVAELKRLPGSRILLVGHCGIFHVLRSYLLSNERPDVNYHSYDSEIILRNTAIGCISFDTSGTQHEIISWNDVSHLTEREPEVYLTV